MNRWIKLSIDYANQRSYLDDLFKIYPTIPEGIREIDESLWKKIEIAYKKQNNTQLMDLLLSLDLFPIKDSYIAYLRRDKTSLKRNPNTVNRICGRLYEMGIDKLYERSTEPKETNRQIGPMFNAWLKSKALGIQPVPLQQFLANQTNAILDGTDAEKSSFAREHLNYYSDKGLDLVARFNRQYVIGEAKFLTDFGGHQQTQFNDAMNLLNSSADAIKVAILDGVLFIGGNYKMHRALTAEYSQRNIMSALLLRDYLYSI